MRTYRKWELATDAGSRVVTNQQGCWLWQGAIGAGGYGLLTLNQRPHRAHVLVFELLVGPVPVGLELDHTCRVKSCVNPAHLEPVTHQENMRRAYDNETCVNGHPWTEANTYIRPSTGRRECRACNRAKRRGRHSSGWHPSHQTAPPAA